MSSNGSMSSSRLSQFGLYRTIDARTEEFLQLSRKRQIRQGCACAAVSTAVTVTVVVSILFVYGYGVGGGARAPGWLGLMNGSADAAPFDDKLKNSLTVDQAAMDLLPVFFDKVLRYNSSSSRYFYETKPVTESNLQKAIFPGINIPSSKLFTIQYKTYPVVYIHSPRNTESYMKLRKTREYQRIMNYIDKMINDKVGFGSNRFVQNQPSEELDNTAVSLQTVATTYKPLQIIKKPIDNQPKTITLQSRNYPHLLSHSDLKYNYTKTKEKSCKCRKQFGILLNKIIQYIQELSQNILGKPQRHMTNCDVENTKLPNITTTSNLTATTASIEPTIFSKPRANKKKKTSTTTPTENLLLMTLLSHKNNNKTNNQGEYNKSISKLSSMLNAVSKQDLHNVTFIQLDKIEDQKYKSTKQRLRTFPPLVTKYTTTDHPPKIDDIFKDILFPEGNVFEIKKNRQKAYEKDPTDIERLLNYKYLSKELPFREATGLLNSNNGTITKYVNISNHVHTINNNAVTPKYPKFSPEEYVFEKFRKKQSNFIGKIISLDPKTPTDSKLDKTSGIRTIGKLKDLSHFKSTQSYRNGLYKNPSSQISRKTSKLLSTVSDVMQKSLGHQSSNNKIKTAYYEQNISKQQTTTTAIPSSTFVPVIEYTSTVSMQFQKYSHDKPIPDVTTKKNNLLKILPKLERKYIPIDSREDFWNEFEFNKIPTFDSTPTTSTPIANNTIVEIKTNKITMNEIVNTTGYTSNISNAHFTKNYTKSNESQENSQTTDYYYIQKQSIIPNIRKSYLEISRGDWKQKEPEIDVNNNVYDVFDEIE